jgi:hypothetical protein
MNRNLFFAMFLLLLKLGKRSAYVDVLEGSDQTQLVN